jgi:hypothetical protein
MLDKWSDPTILSWVALTLNSLVHSETGARPYELTFGSVDMAYFEFPDLLQTDVKSGSFLAKLNEKLRLVREISRAYQEALVSERMSNQLEEQTLFKAGDFVLFQQPDRKSKLQPLYQGPFQVVSQMKNDVEVRNLIRGNIIKVHVSRLKIFHGTLEDAKKMALLDNDQYEIDCLLAYKGDPLKRMRMTFLVRFKDTSEHWLEYSNDLAQTLQFEFYCNLHVELRPLLYTAAQTKTYLSQLNKTPITEVEPGDNVYVDLRCYGSDWFDTLNLPNQYFTRYMVLYTYENFNATRTRIKCYCPVFKERFIVNRDFVQRYGTIKALPHDSVLLDVTLVNQYPQVKPTRKDISALNLILYIANHHY